MVKEMGDGGTDLLIKYFPDERSICEQKGVEN